MITIKLPSCWVKFVSGIFLHSFASHVVSSNVGFVTFQKIWEPPAISMIFATPSSMAALALSVVTQPAALPAFLKFFQLLVRAENHARGLSNLTSVTLYEMDVIRISQNSESSFRVSLALMKLSMCSYPWVIGWHFVPSLGLTFPPKMWPVDS